MAAFPGQGERMVKGFGPVLELTRFLNLALPSLEGEATESARNANPEKRRAPRGYQEKLRGTPQNTSPIRIERRKRGSTKRIRLDGISRCAIAAMNRARRSI
jgi:hypothetical protein